MKAARRAEILVAYQARAAHFAELAGDSHPASRLSVSVTPGSRGPSTRELEVLALVRDGFTNKQIGEELWIAENTVKSHVASVLRLLDARNRAHMVAIAIHRGLVSGRVGRR